MPRPEGLPLRPDSAHDETAADESTETSLQAALSGATKPFGRVRRAEPSAAAGVRVRLSDPALLSEFAGFLAVPRVVVERLEECEIEVRPNGETDGETHRILVELMLKAWNAAHGDAAASIVSAD